MKKSRTITLIKIFFSGIIIASILCVIAYLHQSNCMDQEIQIKDKNERYKHCLQKPVFDFSTNDDSFSNDINNPFHPLHNRK